MKIMGMVVSHNVSQSLYRLTRASIRGGVMAMIAKELALGRAVSPATKS